MLCKKRNQPQKGEVEAHRSEYDDCNSHEVNLLNVPSLPGYFLDPTRRAICLFYLKDAVELQVFSLENFIIFNQNSIIMAKAIGIGGIFIKYKDAKAMREWFETALGLNPNAYGVLFGFDGESRGTLQLGTFPETTTYFGSEAQKAMINFRVDDLVALEKHLRSIGTVICDEIESYDFGKFLHIEDPEGNRIELWEPVDKPFDAETQNAMR